MTKAPKFRRHFILPRSLLIKFSDIFDIFLHFLEEIAMEAPRVNASMLSQYTGKLVCLVGNVTEITSNGREIKLVTSDQRIVRIILTDPLDEQLQGAVEVIGKVERDGTLLGQRIVPYSVDFDLNLYGEALSIISNHPEIFGLRVSNGFGY
ncbi:replication protein A 14 kDa subunit-like [Acropora palmata]|uniref:replication protein A 14 kDa subunit-like n=1 Tax=Acropora palmata TaxID=6131 RepID=UPI003D9FCA80